MTERGKTTKAPAGKVSTGKVSTGRVSTTKAKGPAGKGPTGKGGDPRKGAAEDRRIRAAQLRAEQKAKERKRRIAVIAGGLVVVLAVLGIGIGVGVTQHNKNQLKGVMTFTGLTRNHVTTPVKYAQNPPVGGDHNPEWLNCGVYSQQVPTERAVHDLEHGAVWITYQPNLPAADVAKLRKIVGTQTFIDLSPFPGIPAPVVASAWGKQIRLTGASDDRLPKFIRKYRLGPQTPELGADCTGMTPVPGVVTQ